MAAGPWTVYGAAMEAIARGTIDLDTAAFRLVLVTEAHTPLADVHDTWSDVSTNEVAAAGNYATHGVALVTNVWRGGSPDPGTVTFDCADVSWASSTITARYAMIVKDADANAALAAGDLLLCYCDLNSPAGPSVSTTNGTFAINIAAAGVFTIARA